MTDTIAQRKYCPDCGSLLPDEPHEDWCFCKQYEQRAEADEAIAAMLQEALKAERDELDTVNMLRIGTEKVCDELRRQLTEAQHAIDVLSNTVVAQDATIKRLEQAREDVADYRAEIARLTSKLSQAQREIESIKLILAIGRNVGNDKEQAYQDAEEAADFALANPLEKWRGYFYELMHSKEEYIKIDYRNAMLEVRRNAIIERMTRKAMTA